MKADRAFSFTEGRYTAEDGLELYFREYGDVTCTKTPVICLAGLTRNSIDFHQLATHIASNGRRVISPDYRGRGRSSYDPNWRNYRPEVHLNDVEALLSALNLSRNIIIGTSFGGLLSMALAVKRPTAIAGTVLNDIGPELDPNGLRRITGYIGTPITFDTYEDCVRHQKHLFNHAYPDLDDAAWLDMSKSNYKKLSNGKLVADYDHKIGKSLAASETMPDMWPFFRALGERPCLAIHGALSDILSTQTLSRMSEEVPTLKCVSIPNRGHVPLLNEKPCVEAIDEFIASI